MKGNMEITTAANNTLRRVSRGSKGVLLATTVMLLITTAAYGQFNSAISAYFLLREELPGGTLLKQDVQQVWQRTNLVWETFRYMPGNEVTQSIAHVYHQITGLYFTGRYQYTLLWSNNGGFSSNFVEWARDARPNGTYLGGLDQGWKTWVDPTNRHVMTKVVCSTLYASYKSTIDHCGGGLDYLNLAWWYRTNAAAVTRESDWFIPFSFAILRGKTVDWYIKTPTNTIWHSMGWADQGVRSCIDPYIAPHWKPIWNEALSTNNLPDKDFCLTSPAKVEMLSPGGPITPGSPIFHATGAHPRFRISGLPKHRFTIESSSQLGVWRNIDTVIIPHPGSLVYEDTNTVNAASNFYRVIPQML